MADKRISQLVDRGTVANSDVVPIVVSGASTTNKATISSIQTFMQGNLDLGVTSVGLSMPSAFTVTGSPVTSSGNISVVGAGTVSQYIRGDGSLADFPQGGGGGGSSVNYYLNGSVSQGTIGGVAYLEMNKTPILGAGTDFTINADGYIASFITDAGDPALLEIPAGNWNFETYLQASSAGGTPSFYIELYKVNSGGTATLIASNSATPELIAFGTSTTPYFSALAVPTTTLALTDRLALRYYVTHSGRTITLHTENNTLCQIITTFTTGLTALNGLTAQVQNFATGTSGTDFAISSSTSTHTFNLPTASASNRGALSSANWTTFNNKENAITAGTTSQYYRGDKSFQTLNTAAVPELTNLYYTEARVNANTNVAANTAARHNAVTLGTANGLSLSTQVLSLGLASAGVTGALSGTDWTTFNNKTSNVGTVTSVAAITLGTTGTDLSSTVATGTTTPVITLNVPTASATNRGALSAADWTTFNGKQDALNGTGFVKITGTTISYDNSTYLTTGDAASTYLPLIGGTLTGTLNGTSANFSGNILPKVDNTGVVGSASFTWSNGQFTNLTVDSTMTVTNTLNVRAAIDLADADVLRFGTSDDWELYHDGTNNYSDLNVGNLIIRDNVTTRFTFERTTGNLIATGNVTANSFIKSGGTSSQFLKADGSVDSSTYLTTGTASSTYVPYTGAAANVDLGVYNLTSSAVNVNGSGSNAGVINLESNAIFPLVNGYGTIGSGTTNQFNFYQTTGAGVFRGAILSLNGITASATRTYTLPDADGTLALTSQIPTNPVGGTGAAGRVAYWNGSGTITSDSLFQWNDTFKRLGIGRTPTVSLDVEGSATVSNTIKVESSAGNGLRIYGSSGTNQWDMYLNGTNLRFSDNTGTGSVVFDRPLNGTSAVFTSASSNQLTLNGGTTIANRLLVARGTDDSSQNLLLGWNNITVQRTSVPLSSPQTEFSIIQQGSDASRTVFNIASTGAATFSSSVTAENGVYVRSGNGVYVNNAANTRSGYLITSSEGTELSSFAGAGEPLILKAPDTGGTIRFYTGGSTSASERMRITSTGNVGIGTASPTAKLQVRGANEFSTFFDAQNEGASGATFSRIGNSYPFNRFLFQNGYIDVLGSYMTYPVSIEAQSGGGQLALTRSGAVAEFYMGGTTGGSTVLYVRSGGSGGVYLAAGSTGWVANSDERLKTDLVPIENGLEKVASLRSVIGRYLTDDEDKKRAFLIAQDVEKVLPEAVVTIEETGDMGVNYTEVIPLLVAAIKELKTEIDSLKNQIK